MVSCASHLALCCTLLQTCRYQRKRNAGVVGRIWSTIGGTAEGVAGVTCLDMWHLYFQIVSCYEVVCSCCCAGLNFSLCPKKLQPGTKSRDAHLHPSPSLAMYAHRIIRCIVIRASSNSSLVTTRAAVSIL